MKFVWRGSSWANATELKHAEITMISIATSGLAMRRGLCCAIAARIRRLVPGVQCC
jgi:hypothetical protein